MINAKVCTSGQRGTKNSAVPDFRKRHIELVSRTSVQLLMKPDLPTFPRLPPFLCVSKVLGLTAHPARAGTETAVLLLDVIVGHTGNVVAHNAVQRLVLDFFLVAGRQFSG
jgi:hypothetical protein